MELMLNIKKILKLFPVCFHKWYYIDINYHTKRKYTEKYRYCKKCRKLQFWFSGWHTVSNTSRRFFEKKYKDKIDNKFSDGETINIEVL